MAGIYVIPLGGLKEGRRTFNFVIGNEFFEQFEGSEITEGELESVAEVEKRPSHIDLRISIKGKVKISCDRCLEMFMHTIASENRLLIRVGKKWDDNDPEMITIPADEHELDIKQYLYEFIHLALPIQRIHPPGAGGKSTCNPEMLRKLGQHTAAEDKTTDPRWDELKKLMDNN